MRFSWSSIRDGAGELMSACPSFLVAVPPLCSARIVFRCFEAFVFPGIHTSELYNKAYYVVFRHINRLPERIL